MWKRATKETKSTDKTVAVAPVAAAPLLADADSEGQLECDIAVIGGGIAFQHAVRAAAAGGGKRKRSVTACLGNPFIEFSHAAPIFLADPSQHRRFLCGEPAAVVVKGIRYIADVLHSGDQTPAL